MTRNVLIIDDEANMRWVLGQALEQAGYTAHGASGGDESMHILARNPIDLVLLDLKLRGEDGLVVLRQVRERWPDVVVMMLTAYGTVPNAVEAMHLGAADFLRKPFDVEEVMVKVARALERRAMQQQIAHLTATQFDSVAFNTLIGTSVVWQDTLRQAQTLVTSESDVLFVGGSGSGRASVARAIHAASTRHRAPLIECDMRIYHDPLVTLFGNEHHEGLWAAAGSGTLLIRHLDDVPETLPVLGERLAESTGHQPRLFIVTHHQSIAMALAAQCGAYLTIPALCERPGDIALLSRTFAPDHQFTPEAMQLLEHYHWPENVTELRGVIQRAVQLAGAAPIDVPHLPSWMVSAATALSTYPMTLPDEGIRLEAVEQGLIKQALERAYGNKSKAAELLGLTRHTLLYRMEKYGISAQERD